MTSRNSDLAEDEEYLNSKKSNELRREFEREELEMMEFSKSLRWDIGSNKDQIEALKLEM